MKALQYLIKSFFFLIVISLLLNAVFFVVFGAYKSYEAYLSIISGNSPHPVVDILATTDIFFLGIVLIILAIGIAKLFLPGSFFSELLVLPWMNITNLSQLKLILWETLMLALVIFFIVQLAEKIDALTYEILLIPASIVLLTLSLYLIKKKKNEED